MELLNGFNVEEDKEYIYLVMVEYKDKTLLKVGYSKTLEGRMDTYELHNPDIQLLKIREGTRELENYFHKKFEKYAYPKRREWFYYNEEIVESFDILEEKNLLDINQLKNKISKLLKPKSISELKKIYYEVYKEEIKWERVDKNDLDTILTEALSFINSQIEDFINTLDYSEMPEEINSNTFYRLTIPNPLTSEEIFINLGHILKDKSSLYTNVISQDVIKVISRKHKTTQEEFNQRLEEKRDKSMRLLSFYRESNVDEQQALAKVYQDITKICHYKYNYIAVNKTLIPEFNNLMMIFEMRVFEIQQLDYKNRFTILNTIREENTVQEEFHDSSTSINSDELI